MQTANTADETLKSGATSQINNDKLYVPTVIPLCLKYRFEITTQPKSSNLDYLIDPTFKNISRLFVLSFKIDDDDPTRNYFDEYYMPVVEIKILMD